MKKYNISTSLIWVIKHLYDKATNAVLFNSSIGDWFQTTVGVQLGCLLSPTLFNIFLERIVTDVLEDDEGTVSTGGRTITNLCFADAINGLAGEEEDLVKLVEHLYIHSLCHGDQCQEDQVGDKQHQWHQPGGQIKWTEAWESYKLQVPVLSCIWWGFQAEIIFRIVQTTAAFTRLKPVWIDLSIFLSSKIQLMHSLVTSIFLYACESWTLTADLQGRIRAMRCSRKVLCVSYKDHVTNDEVCAKMQLNHTKTCSS